MGLLGTWSHVLAVAVGRSITQTYCPAVVRAAIVQRTMIRDLFRPSLAIMFLNGVKLKGLGR